jgi:DUF4097 and DUF4098 domain-containing protein YvlB
MKYTVIGGALLTATLAATGCEVSVDSQGQVVREEKRFTTAGTPVVRVATFDGSIQIQSWDKPGILIEIEKRGPTKESIDSLQITTDQTGDTIELEVKRPASESFHGFGFHRSPSARLMVSVPRRVDVRARSGDGSIRVDHVSGRVDLHTGDGSIHATDVTGELTIHTGDGSVTVDGADGRLNLETGDGGVNVTGKLTSLRAHTGDGSIVFRGEPGTTMSDDWEIETGDGGVSLYLPTDFDANLDAHTGDGTIRNDLEIKAGSDGEISKRTVRGRLGEGGKRMRIRTGDGSISLRRQ